MKRRTRPFDLLLPLVLLVALLAGCGGDGGGSSAPAGPDPATVTPADAPLFAEAVVRPEGDRKEALESALSKLLATDDPGAFVVERLDKWLAAEDAGITYEEDIEPWLGEQAGFFLADVRRGRRRRDRHRGDRPEGGERGDRQVGRGRRRCPSVVARMRASTICGIGTAPRPA